MCDVCYSRSASVPWFKFSVASAFYSRLCIPRNLKNICSPLIQIFSSPALLLPPSKIFSCRSISSNTTLPLPPPPHTPQNLRSHRHTQPSKPLVGRWYVSIVSTSPNTFDLVLDSNLHDLKPRTDSVFSRIAMVLFLCRKKSSRNDLKLHREYFWNL